MGWRMKIINLQETEHKKSEGVGQDFWIAKGKANRKIPKIDIVGKLVDSVLCEEICKFIEKETYKIINREKDEKITADLSALRYLR